MARLGEGESGAWDRIDAVYCAASGVPDHDRAELAALERAFGHPDGPWVTSIKGATGDFGGAGALTAAAAALSVAAGAVIPVIGLETPRPAAVRVAAGRRPIRPAAIRRVLVTGVARGGGGAALLLGRPEAAARG
jgi:3-oxoacyl-(acyl-carrier-protein) synthase